MMELIRVCDPNTDETCGDYHWRHCDPDDLKCVQGLAATDCFLKTSSSLEHIACVARLGTPDAVCGPNACGSDADCDGGACVENLCTNDNACADDDDCPLSDKCIADLCVPTPCPVPCAPNQTCQHGVCR
jgi:hypothetical protein